MADSNKPQESIRSKYIRLSRTSILCALIALVVGFIMGGTPGAPNYIFYILAIVLFVLSFVIFYFARKHPENEK